MARHSFQIHVPDVDLDDLRQRLANTRLPRAPAAEPWESGVDYEYLRDLVDYWKSGFDWRHQEDRLNEFPQYMSVIEGQEVHHVHVRADRDRYSNAIPIILSHGWPYSFVEFLDFSKRLSDPLIFGGSANDAFDVVIPSLPGYGYSPPLVDDYFTDYAVAALWHRLMVDELQYERYATYGEDVGTSISDWMGALYPDSVVGLFATHAAFPPDKRSENLTKAEQDFRDWLSDKWRTARGYSAVQSTRPDTLAVGLNDSPSGLLAWLVEKFHEWSGPHFDQSWTPDDILTTTSLYWFTQSIGTSFLPYFHGRVHDKPIPLVDVPVGVAVQWGERGFPREYAERTYTDLRNWTELPSGGHFTAKQSPDLVASAMREFFSDLRD
jgi:pimeloyl-ACP methyl ester carboxylesterase